ncbi:MAG TPA: flagellar basal body-associated FliL family protein [Candidatus Deferrimicrobium sp.]|nr:flagellar basal body-associated FliL family protein [Candidatus Deferrimicrobium sp.]
MADEGFVERRTADRRAKKSGFPFILVIIIIAVVMGAGGFFAGKIFSGRGDILSTPASRIQTTPIAGQKKPGQKQRTPGTRANSTSGQIQPEGQKGESTGSGGEDDDAKIKPGIIMLDAFTVNLNDPFGRRYAEVAVNLVVDDKLMVNRITGNELMIPQIRDEIFMIISGKSYADLKSTSGKVTLKEEIMIRVNEILKEEFRREPVIQVLFTKFLIQ